MKHLCDLSEEELERVRNLISDETVYRRPRHAVSENARVNEAIDVSCKKGIWFVSGIDGCVASLIEGRLRGYWCRDGYAGGGRAEVAGRAGVSDHGGGFGGCTVSLVKEDNVQEFIEKLAPVYHDKIGLNAEFYVADIGDGVRKIY